MTKGKETMMLFIMDEILVWKYAMVLLSGLATMAQQPQIVFFRDTTSSGEYIDNISSSYTNTTLSFKEVDGGNSFAVYNLICQAIDQGAVAIIGEIQCGLLPGIPSLMHSVEVPLIQINAGCMDAMDVVMGENEYVHYMPSLPPDASEAVQLVLRDLAWQDIALIHDEIQDGASEDPIYAAITAANASVQTFRVRAGQVDQDVRHILNQSFQAESMELHFVVTCSVECKRELFEQVNLFDQIADQQALFTFKAHWLLVGDRDLPVVIQSAIGEIDNVLILVPSHDIPNTTLQYALSALKQIDLGIQTVSSVYPAAVLLANDSAGCAHRLGIAPVLAHQLQLQTSLEYCTNCTTYEVYTAMWGVHHQRHLASVAEWSQQGGLTKHSQLFPNVGFGLNNRHLRVGMKEWGPFLMQDDTSPHGYSGLCMELLLELSTNLNFSFTITNPEDGQWGAENDDSTWTGLMGILQRKQVDLVVSSLSELPRREMFVDFTVAYYIDYTTVLMRYPDAESTRWRLYLRPFSWPVWLVLVITVPFSGCILWLLSRHSPFYTHKQARSGLGAAQDAFLYTFGALFTQGGVSLPGAQSGRFFVGFYWMSCIVIVATYSGNLIAYLTVTKTEVPMATLEDLAYQDTYKFGLLGGASLGQTLNMSKGRVYKKLIEKISEFYTKDPTILSSNHTYHIQRVLSSDYAYIGEKTGFEMAISEHCDIDMISEEFRPYAYAVALHNNSAYLPLFDSEITLIKESGLINKWKAKWWPRQVFCSRGMVTEAKPVSLEDVQGAYYLVAIAITLAFLALGIEEIYRRSNAMTFKNAGTGNNLVTKLRTSYI